MSETEPEVQTDEIEDLNEVYDGSGDNVERAVDGKQDDMEGDQ